MENLTKYILFVFGENDNPKVFTQELAEELTVLSDTPRVNFYFGPEHSVLTFSTLDTFEDVSEYLEMILGLEDVIYILVPYSHDKLSYNMPINLIKNLFDDDKCDFLSGKDKEESDDDISVQKMMQDNFKGFWRPSGNDLPPSMSFRFIDNEDDEDDDIKKLKMKKSKPSLDFILDKIKESGTKSLTDEEIKLLNKYSK